MIDVTTFRLFDCFFFDDFCGVSGVFGVAAVDTVVVEFTFASDIVLLLICVKLGVFVIPLWPINWFWILFIWLCRVGAPIAFT